MAYSNKRDIDIASLDFEDIRELRLMTQAYKKGLGLIDKFCKRKTFVRDETGSIVEADFLGVCMIGTYEAHSISFAIRPFDVWKVLGYDDDGVIRPNSFFFMICAYNDQHGHEEAYNFIIDLIIEFEDKQAEFVNGFIENIWTINEKNNISPEITKKLLREYYKQALQLENTLKEEDNEYEDL